MRKNIVLYLDISDAIVPCNQLTGVHICPIDENAAGKCRVITIKGKTIYGDIALKRTQQNAIPFGCAGVVLGGDSVV